MSSKGDLMYSGADFSPCRTWRYTLWRVWSYDGPVVGFIGLNPSTADEHRDDPTVRRCINYARAWGYGSMFMLNIFAYRATDPSRLHGASDPVGPMNDWFLTRIYERCALVVAAWGVYGAFRNRGARVMEMLPVLKCLGVTASGFPRHPLYLRTNLKPLPFWPQIQVVGAEPVVVGYENLCSTWCLIHAPRNARKRPDLYKPVMSDRRGLLDDLTCDVCDRVVLPARADIEDGLPFCNCGGAGIGGTRRIRDTEYMTCANCAKVIRGTGRRIVTEAV